MADFELLFPLIKASKSLLKVQIRCWSSGRCRLSLGQGCSNSTDVATTTSAAAIPADATATRTPCRCDHDQCRWSVARTASGRSPSSCCRDPRNQHNSNAQRFCDPRTRDNSDDCGGPGKPDDGCNDRRAGTLQRLARSASRARRGSLMCRLKFKEIVPPNFINGLRRSPTLIASHVRE
jgi:hypothetical protein